MAADLEFKLHRLGHEVVGCVASGAEAVRLSEAELPDLVLMDIRLQGDMDGVEAASRLQATTDAKVIFVSAFGQLSRPPNPETKRHVFLTKPYSSSQLQAVLRSTLE